MNHVTEHTIRLARARERLRELLNPATDEERSCLGWLLRIGETHVLEAITAMVERRYAALDLYRIACDNFADELGRLASNLDYIGREADGGDGS